MADDIKIKWLYPQNFRGTYDQGVQKGHKRHIIQCLNYSDGTGEDDSLKVKRTDLLTIDGNVPAKLVIDKIEYNVQGMTVRISYNNENDEEVAIIKDSEGVKDFTSLGGCSAPIQTSCETMRYAVKAGHSRRRRPVRQAR